MAKNQSVSGNFHYNNIEKKNKNFMYKNLQRSHCYHCNFSASNFDYVSFRGAHFKSCDFSGATFRWAEFIGSNLKEGLFKNAIFENTIFDSVNLEEANFKGAQFKNTIFLNTHVEKAINLNLKDLEIKIYQEMPALAISEELAAAFISCMNNPYVKKARVLDTKDGKLNSLSVLILGENFDETCLIQGLKWMELQLDKEFYTLSYLIKMLKNYQKED